MKTVTIGTCLVFYLSYMGYYMFARCSTHFFIHMCIPEMLIYGLIFVDVLYYHYKGEIENYRATCDRLFLTVFVGLFFMVLGMLFDSPLYDLCLASAVIGQQSVSMYFSIQENRNKARFYSDYLINKADLVKRFIVNIIM